MAAPTLRHYLGSPPAAAWTLIGTVVPAGRVLVVSKIVIACTANGPAATVALAIATSTAVVSAQRINSALLINQGEAYTETGVVMLPGEGLFVFASVTELGCHVFGQEVDL